MVDYELLGVFYLGKKHPAGKDELVLYDSRELVRHAVCVGMDGAGKTGLGIDLIEEAAIDNVPVIAIDTKGDLCNLLLTFPRMDAESFVPWIDADEARRLNVTPDELAKREALRWRQGLSDCNEDPTRIEKLQNSAEFKLYTPASSIGIPLSLHCSFRCPSQEIVDDDELLREQIRITITSVLTLAGIDADPLRSKEFILLSSIVDSYWKQQKDLQIVDLVEQIQNPPIATVGAIKMEAFFPRKERDDFALTINNLLSSSAFEAWMKGEPLDIGKLLYTSTGKNKVSIVSVAHLPDAERMFFVSHFLSQLCSWMKNQSSTSSLRAIVYLDDVIAYLPSAEEPPSKRPLVALLKEAQTYGLGLVLATSNAADLDYKAIGKVGTWFVGRLETDRDRQSLLDAWEATTSWLGARLDRGFFDRELSTMPAQVFLMHNLNQSPIFIKTRWTLSYLRGCLSRTQLKALKARYASETAQVLDRTGEVSRIKAVEGSLPGRVETKQDVAPQATGGTKIPRPPGAGALFTPASAPASPQLSSASTSKATGLSGSLPGAVSELNQRFARVGREGPEGARLIYKPMLFASAQLRFSDTKFGVDCVQTINLLTLIKEGDVPVRWEKALDAGFDANSLEREPDTQIELPALPGVATVAENHTRWRQDFQDWFPKNQKLEIFRCPFTSTFSRAPETEGEFRVRLQHVAREKRDALVSSLSAKYQERLSELDGKFQYAKRILDEQIEQSGRLMDPSAYSQEKKSMFETVTGKTMFETVTGFKKPKDASEAGHSLFESLVGRKIPTKLLGEEAVSEEAAKIESVGRAQGEVETTQDYLDSVQDQISATEYEFQKEMNELKAQLDPATRQLETFSIAPREGSMKVLFFCLCWAPCFKQPDGKITAAW